MTNLEREKIEQKRYIDDMDVMKFASEFIDDYGCGACIFWDKNPCGARCYEGFVQWLKSEDE